MRGRRGGRAEEESRIESHLCPPPQRVCMEGSDPLDARNLQDSLENFGNSAVRRCGIEEHFACGPPSP